VANTPAYYDTATITAVKSFIVQAPGIKAFFLLNSLSYHNLESKSVKPAKPEFSDPTLDNAINIFILVKI
jgi:hypothetical protein